MRIVHLNTFDSMGGADIACKRISQALTHYTDAESEVWVNFKKNNQSQSLALNKNRVQKGLAWLRFIAERLYFLSHEASQEVRYLFSPARFGMSINHLKVIQEADIIHLHWINFGFLSLQSLKEIMAIGKPIVWTMHDCWAFTGGCHHVKACENYKKKCGNCPYLNHKKPTDISNQIWEKKKLIYEEASFTLVACSQWLCSKAKESHLLTNKSVVSIPNPMDTQLFFAENKETARQKLGLPRNKKILLFVAMKLNHPYKGFHYFEKAIEKLAIFYSEDELCVVVVGEGESKLSENCPFEVYFLGKQTDTEKLRLIYSSATFFVIPSVEENLPNTIMEAMACGTPAIGFSVGGIPEMIDNEQNGFIANQISEENLTHTIQKALNYPDYEDLVQNSLLKVKTHYSEKTVATQYYNLYKRILEQQKD